MANAPKTLHHNPRFYILASSIIMSVLIASWLRLAIPSDQLFSIRLQQTLGLLAIIYWYIALLVSPLQKRFPGMSFMPYLLFSRRAIGVSATYFALLHIVIAVFGQLGGVSGISLLPPRFFIAVLLGFTAFLILLAMTVTSFDKVVAKMTFPRWKFLHRFGYLAGILAMLHIWMIGTHLSYGWLQLLAFTLLASLFWLESDRLAGTIAKKYVQLKGKERTLATILWLVLSLLVLTLPQTIGSTNNHHLQKTEQQ